MPAEAAGKFAIASEARVAPVQMTAKVYKVGERFALVAAWIVVAVFFTIALPGKFATVGDVASILSSQVVVLLLCLALLIPLIAGDYDLSVGYNMVLAAMIIAVLNGQDHVSVVIAVVVAVAVALTVGAVNAAATLYFGIDSLIVTLGTGTLASGLTLLISNSAVVTGVSPGLVEWISSYTFLGVALEFWYGILLAVIVWYILRFTPVGARLLFVGRSRNVARLSGLHVTRLRAGAFLAAGALSGIVGIVFAGTLDGADPSAGAIYLLPAFAAAFLGATTVTPGRFNVWGSFVAVYFLGTGIAGLEIFGLASWIQPVFYGGALVIAVAISQLLRGRRALQTGGGA